MWKMGKVCIEYNKLNKTLWLLTYKYRFFIICFRCFNLFCVQVQNKCIFFGENPLGCRFCSMCRRKIQHIWLHTWVFLIEFTQNHEIQSDEWNTKIDQTYTTFPQYYCFMSGFINIVCYICDTLFGPLNSLKINF